MDEFRKIVLYMAPRILGLMDRDPGSSTFGCCDRYYWHYKLHDVSNARLQEAGFFLALLYSHDFEGNIYYKNSAVKDWTLASVKFWEKLLQGDGSAAEVYPFERSYCATAFSTWAALETLALLSASDLGAAFHKKVAKTGHWLMANTSEDAANQMAAAALALYDVGRMTRQEIFGDASRALIEKIVRRYRMHGFHAEYGGFDVGYTSIINSLLVWHLCQGCSSPGVDSCVRDSQARIDAATGPDGQYAFADKSRRTQFLYPYGFFAMRSPVFGKILKGVTANTIITPLWMDDRYCMALAVDYLMTLIALKRSGDLS